MDERKLDFWIARGLNVLFTGRHGVGKTAQVIAAFQRNNLTYRYFSAATMDPWVDFIGVPRPVENAEGRTVLQLVQPEDFATDSIDALFFDELNRAHKKVRNAVMELIQFRSINGRRFNNLKVIWAAINPDDEEDTYDVERLDPAQEDRFHVKIEIPYRPSVSFFRSKYGVEMGNAACQWWNEAPEAVRDKISPRRLDYALDLFQNNGDVRDVLPQEANATALVRVLNVGGVETKLRTLYSARNVTEAKTFLQRQQNWEGAIQYITDNNSWMKFFFPLVDKERLTALISRNRKARKYVIKNHTQFADLLNEVRTARQDLVLVGEITEVLVKKGTITEFSDTPYDGRAGWESAAMVNDYRLDISSGNTQDRRRAYAFMARYMPRSFSDVEHAVKLAQILRDIVKRTQAGTLNRDMKSAANMAQYLFNTVKTMRNKTSAEVLANYNVFKDMLTNMAKKGAIK